jgi:uncharacterized protein YjbK
MGTVDQHLEIEIKLKLDSFADYLKLVGFLGSPDAVLQQRNCFFDSEDHRLMKEGWALRVRVESSRGLVTLKSTAFSYDEELAVMREEIEEEINTTTAAAVIDLRKDVLSLDVAPVRFVKDGHPDIQLARLVGFRNTRQCKKHRFGDFTYELLLDKTEFSDGSCDYELELELERPEQSATVVPALKKLFGSLDIGFAPQSETKFARALACSGLNLA